MAVTTTPRAGVTRWSDGADPFTRAQMEASFAALEDRVAIDAQGTLAARSDAGVRGRYYRTDENPPRLYRDTGAAWEEVLTGAAGAAAYVAKAGGSEIAPPAAGIGLVLRAAVGATGSLLEVRDPANVVRSRISSAGSLHLEHADSVLGVGLGNDGTTQALIVSGASTRVGLIVRARAGQGNALQEWQNSASAVVAAMRVDGVLTATMSQAGVGIIGLRDVQVGAPDSAGLGYRTVRVAN